MALPPFVKRLINFNAAKAASGTDVIYTDQGSGEVAMTAAQLATLVQAPIANGTAPDAGTLTGAESVSVSRGAGLLQTTWNTVAALVIGTFLGFVQFGFGATARTILAKLLDFPITPEDFGAKGDGTTNDSAAIQRAIDALSAAGGGIIQLNARVYRACGLILKTGVILKGAFRDAVIIMAPDGWNATSVLDTFAFDTYKFTAGVPTDANTPNGCGLVNIVIDGNLQSFGGVASATSGYGARLGAVRLMIDNVTVRAAPGTGLHTSLGFITRLSAYWYRRDVSNGYINNLNLYGNGNDGWVHDGPGDLVMSNVFAGVNGWPDTATYAASFPSILEPGRRVANIVINTASEIGKLHTFGCTQGDGLVIGRPSYGTGTIRVKWDEIITESCNRGLWTRNGAYFQGSILDLHNNFGIGGAVAGAEYWRDDGGVLQGHVDQVTVDLGANNNGQNIIVLVGDFKSIGKLMIDGRYFPSQALVVGGTQNRVLDGDIARMGPQASKTGILPAIHILSTAANWTVRCRVRDSDTIATIDEISAGVVPSPEDSHIVGAFNNTTVTGKDFVNFSEMSTTQRRTILLHNLSGDKRSRGYTGQSANVSATATTLQTVNIPIAALFPPNADEIQLSLAYVSGGQPTLNIPPMFNNSNQTAAQVQAYLQFAATNSGVVRVVASVP